MFFPEYDWDKKKFMKNYSQGEIDCMSIYQFMFSTDKNDFL